MIGSMTRVLKSCHFSPEAQPSCVLVISYWLEASRSGYKFMSLSFPYLEVGPTKYIHILDIYILAYFGKRDSEREMNVPHKRSSDFLHI